MLMFNGVKWVSLTCVMDVSERYLPTIPSTVTVCMFCRAFLTTWCHIPEDSIFLLLSALLSSLELPLFWLLVVAGVHRFFKHLGANSKFQVPEG
jgi:hypothetical protein